MDVVGLARTPRRIAEPLSAVALSTASAAAELPALVRGRDDRDGLYRAVGEARLLWRRVVGETSHVLGGGLDRGDVLAIALSQKAVADRLDEAAAALPPGATGEAWADVAGVIRDSARELAAAVERLDGPRRERDGRLDRVESLHAEGRRLLREARARLLTSSVDPIAALADHDFLQRLERVLIACRSSARAIRLVVVKHA